MPTIKDVAKEAGVSIATVSYVLNNKAAAVSEETRREVWRAVEKIGYMPNVTARNLRSSQSRLIGYAWHAPPPNGLLNDVLEHFTFFLAQAAEQAGYHLLTFTYPTDNPIRMYDELIRTGRVDGFILASTQEHDTRIRYLLDKRFPFIAFGRSNPDWDFSWVDTDGEAGVRAAVDLLIKRGHTRIAMIAWDEGSLTGRFRFQGYAAALRQAGLSLRPDYIFRGEHSDRTGRDALTYWWAMPPDERPTAIFAISDLIAVGVIHEAARCGIEIGRDLALIGHDNVPLSEFLSPPLATLEQPLDRIASALIENLCDVLAKPNGGKHPVRQVLIPPRLLVRASANFVGDR
ncbi:MAG: LacI family DNA-binding transcriptional regulator [bacterium]|nr:LacI family DNA-binding transcriptional regulator [bacterium]